MNLDEFVPKREGLLNRPCPSWRVMSEVPARVMDSYGEVQLVISSAASAVRLSMTIASLLRIPFTTTNLGLNESAPLLEPAIAKCGEVPPQ